jgi:MFS superfamily sulfate permease-like transporter
LQIIFIEQLVPMLGLAAVLAHPPFGGQTPHRPIDKLAFIINNISRTNRATAILSFSSLAILIIARSIKARVVTRPGGRWVKYVSEIFLVVAGTTGKLP